MFFFLNTLWTLEAEHGINSKDRRADSTHFSDAGAQANFHRALRLKTTARGRNPRATKGPARRRMGYKRQRIAFDLSDLRATDAPDPSADFSLNYELGLANFAAIPDHEQEPEEEEPLPEPEEPAPANFDPSDLFAYFFRVQAERAREAFILNGN